MYITSFVTLVSVHTHKPIHTQGPTKNNNPIREEGGTLGVVQKSLGFESLAGLSMWRDLCLCTEDRDRKLYIQGMNFQKLQGFRPRLFWGLDLWRGLVCGWVFLLAWKLGLQRQLYTQRVILKNLKGFLPLLFWCLSLWWGLYNVWMGLCACMEA